MFTFAILDFLINSQNGLLTNSCKSLAKPYKEVKEFNKHSELNTFDTN